MEVGSFALRFFQTASNQSNRKQKKKRKKTTKQRYPARSSRMNWLSEAVPAVPSIARTRSPNHERAHGPPTHSQGRKKARNAKTKAPKNTKNTQTTREKKTKQPPRAKQTIDRVQLFQDLTRKVDHPSTSTRRCALTKCSRNPRRTRTRTRTTHTQAHIHKGTRLEQAAGKMERDRRGA